MNLATMPVRTTTTSNKESTYCIFFANTYQNNAMLTNIQQTNASPQTSTPCSWSTGSAKNMIDSQYVRAIT
jgi:hypothetical protein